ncbi:MAG: HAMP domain-containing histidine kinase [Cyanobacteria bacterium]|nr:HAMP domain-containing histidine kinase [Cyanobacteriota bacterium]
MKNMGVFTSGRVPPPGASEDSHQASLCAASTSNVPKKGLVVDTITTRFLILFIFFSFLPLFSLIFFTVNTLHQSLEAQGNQELQRADSLLQSGLSHQSELLQEKIQVLIQLSQAKSKGNSHSLSSPCLSHPSFQFCRVMGATPGQFIAPGHEKKTSPFTLEGFETLSPQKNFTQPFYQYMDDALYLMAVVPLQKQQRIQYVLVGQKIDDALLREMFRFQQSEAISGGNPFVRAETWILPPEPRLSSRSLNRTSSSGDSSHVVSQQIIPPKIILRQESASSASSIHSLTPSEAADASLKLNALAMNTDEVMSVSGVQYRVFIRGLYDFSHRQIAKIAQVLPLDSQQESTDQVYWAIYVTALTSLLMSVLLAILFARSITQPLLKLIQQVDTLSYTGDLSQAIVIRGVYEINQLALVFNRMLERLRLEHQMRDDFVATLTHDLKVPLLAEKQSLDFFEKGRYGVLNETQSEVVKLMSETNGSVLTLVNGILEVYRYDSGQVQLMFESVDPLELLNTVLEPIGLLCQSKQIQLERALKASEAVIIPPVWIDKQEIKRVLLNLLSNAIANTPKTGKIRCTLHTQETLARRYVSRVSDFEKCTLIHPVDLESRVLICIEDSGIGFMNEDLPTLFQRFAANRGRNPMSIGLGLYNCYQVIQAHHGVLWVETTEGKGSCVCFVLPCSEAMIQERRRIRDRRHIQS